MIHLRGADTYQLSSGELFDVITDSDGNGTLWVDGVQLTGGKKAADNYWISTDGAWGYLLTSSGDLIISQGTTQDRVTLRDWQGGAGNHLGITLDDTPAPVTPQSGALFFTGDQRARLIGIETRLDLGPASARYNIDAWSETTWAADGTLAGGVAQANFADVIDASAAGAGGAVIHGWGGNDALAGSMGKDDLFGDDGDDLIGGGAGSDTIRGGAGKDHILSAHGLGVPQRLSPTEQWTPPPGTTAWISAPNWGVYSASPDHYTVYGGGPVSPVDDAPDVVDGGAGDDRITGGGGDDDITGGRGADRLMGDAGNDALRIASNSIAARGLWMGVSGLFDTKNRGIEGRKRCRRWQFDRSDTEAGCQRFLRQAAHTSLAGIILDAEGPGNAGRFDCRDGDLTDSGAWFRQERPHPAACRATANNAAIRSAA